jgi:hypothetical protein
MAHYCQKGSNKSSSSKCGLGVSLASPRAGIAIETALAGETAKRRKRTVDGCRQHVHIVT